MQKFVSLITFLQKVISKKHVVVIMEFPNWVQVKMKIYTIETPEAQGRSRLRLHKYVFIDIVFNENATIALHLHIVFVSFSYRF